MASEYGGSDRDEVSGKTAALLGLIKILKWKARAKIAREEWDALIAAASRGSGSGGSASDKAASCCKVVSSFHANIRAEGPIRRVLFST